MNAINLYKHQKETVEFLSKNPYALNASEVGTGKTYPSIVESIGKRTVVVAPAFLCKNWKREFAKFGIDAHIVLGKDSNYNNRHLIISQDIIYKHAPAFHAIDLLVVDEVHGFCNIKARRTKALHAYVSSFRPKQLQVLSGTPMRNRIPEYYSILLLLDTHSGKFKARFPNLWLFNMRYCHKVEKRIMGRTITSWEGGRNISELNEWIRPKFIKFLRTDLQDIPDVTFEEVITDIQEEKPILMVEEGGMDGWENLIGTMQPIPMHISIAKKKSAIAKVPFVRDFAGGLLDSGLESLVIFSDHISPVVMLEPLFKNAYGAAVITGETSMELRDEHVQAFQTGNIRVLLGTIGAMGTGLTLTRAYTAIFIDRSWVPAQNKQAVGRLQRLTQENKVRIIDIVTEGIDEKITRKLKEKEKLLSEVMV